MPSNNARISTSIVKTWPIGFEKELMLPHWSLIISPTPVWPRVFQRAPNKRMVWIPCPPAIPLRPLLSSLWSSAYFHDPVAGNPDEELFVDGSPSIPDAGCVTALSSASSIDEVAVSLQGHPSKDLSTFSLNGSSPHITSLVQKSWIPKVQGNAYYWRKYRYTKIKIYDSQVEQ